ncbi:MAG TPA: hypothetical protein VGG66_07015 [Rhizomicrobium sp.]
MLSERITLPESKTVLLKAFLGGLPGPTAGRLAMAVETDRLMDGRGLPHEVILEGLRPTLRRENFDRRPTPLRLFCRPFQDLLTCQPRKVKQKAAIARGSLVPVWNWVSQSLIPDAAHAFVKFTKICVLNQRLENAIACAAEFWPIAGNAINQALSTEVGRQAAQKCLGGAFAVEDAAEMAMLLQAGEAIEQLSALLPAPVASFQDQLIWDVCKIYDQLAETHPDAATYVPVITMNRLSRPWEALRLPLLVTRHTDETLISNTDMGLIGEILFERMEALKESIQDKRHPSFNAEELMEEVKAFTDLSSNIVKEIELKRQGEWGRRLLTERAQIGKAMEKFMERAPREISQALPTHRSGKADYRVPEERREMAMRYARLVAGSSSFAAAASFTAKQHSVSQELCAMLKRYNEDLLKALKAEPRNEIVTSQFEFCAEMTAILFSEDEAELLRRRARAHNPRAAS